MPRARRNAPIEAFYIVDSVTGCWNWTQNKNQKGYGLYRYNGGIKMAHRYLYIKYKGTIPAGLEIDHLCRNRACVNPDHLETVTHTINRRRSTQTKLTEFQVAKIRERYPYEMLKDIARDFNVALSTIDRIGRNEMWKGIS